MRAYIGLGANLNEPAAQLHDALVRLAAYPGIHLHAQSSLYRSAPLGSGPQPDYCNAVCAIDTTLPPDELLTVLHEIERAMGRQRPPQRWAPRLIDLDLLHCDGVRMKSGRLTLPHAEIGNRSFVLIPLAEIAPELELPGVGGVRDAARRCASLKLWKEL